MVEEKENYSRQSANIWVKQSSKEADNKPLKYSIVLRKKLSPRCYRNACFFKKRAMCVLQVSCVCVLRRVTKKRIIKTVRTGEVS